MAVVDLATVKYYVVAVLKDGKQLHLEKVAENIAWEENEKELAVRLNLTLRDVPYNGGRLSEVLALCTVIYLYSDWGTGQQEVFRGTIWKWGHSQTHDDSIIITGYDLLFYLQKSTDSKYYAKGKSTKSIVSDILGDWKVPLGEYTAANETHEKILYKNRTISAMLTDTLEDARKLGGKKSFIRASKGKADFLAYGSNTDIYSFTAESNLTMSDDDFDMTPLVTRVQVLGKDDKNGRPKVEATINGKTEYGILQRSVVKGSSTLKEAKAEAQSMLDEKGSPTRTIRLRSPEFPLIRKGDLIYVTTDQMKGYFHVKGISHNATNMTMQMEVEPK